MEALVALEIPDGAAEVGADGVGHREAFLTVAEDEDLFFRQKGGRAEREIRRVADFEGLRRFVKYARRQKADHRSQAHADRGTQGDQAGGAPTEEGSSLHALLSGCLFRNNCANEHLGLAGGSACPTYN